MALEDFDNLEKMLLLIVNYSENIYVTRIQKLAIVINVSLGKRHDDIHNPYLFGGFSDEVEEGIGALHEQGYLAHDNNKFVLSAAGKKEIDAIIKENHQLADNINGVVQALKGFSDKEVIALTYKLFPDLADKSVIREDMDKIIKRLPVVELNLKKKD